MDMKLSGWSEPEQAIAKTAFDSAYQRAIAALIAAGGNANAGRGGRGGPAAANGRGN